MRCRSYKTNMTKYATKNARLIRERARGLEIGKCYTNCPNWNETGYASIIVTRKHKQGTYTVGIYLLDTWCRGIINTTGAFSIDEDELEDIMDGQAVEAPLTEISYNEAHNIIYAALEWAEGCGLKPHEEWWYTQYILEEDDDHVPLIEYEMGLKGQYFLNSIDQKGFDKVYPTIKQTLGHDIPYHIHRSKSELGEMVMNYLGDEQYESLFGRKKNADDWKDEDEWDEEEEEEEGDENDNLVFEDFIEPNTPQGPHPDLIHPELRSMINAKNPANKLPVALTWPAEELRHDLEAIIRYQFGDEDSWDYCPRGTRIAIALLAEVGNEQSLDLILETLRQDSDYYYFLVDDDDSVAYSGTLAILGREHLDKLMQFMMEPGHENNCREEVMIALLNMAKHWPKMLPEIIDWWQKLLEFYVTALPQVRGCDSETAGLTINYAVQTPGCDRLLPVIRQLFGTNLMDTRLCGDLERVENDIEDELWFIYKYLIHPLDINKRLKKLPK